jgi:plastocyanin
MRFPELRLKALAPAMLATAALAFAACGGDNGYSGTTAPSDEGAAAATNTESSGNAPPPSGNAARAEKVEVVNFAYDPDPVKIEEGGKVIWINRDSTLHTATADDGSFDTGTLDEGKLKSETFKNPGEYTYFCEIHPSMHGTVEVVPSE